MIGIIGANSFIGRNLAHVLDGKSVVLFARNYAGFPENLDASERHEMDFARPKTFIKEARACSTLILLANGGNDDFKFYEAFLDEIDQEQGQIEHLIYASSGGTVYGETEYVPIKEDHVKVPISNYGQTKLKIENLILERAARASWGCTILRIANPIGLHGKKPSLVSAAIAAAKSGEALKLWAEERYVRDYFAVEDLCDAVLKVLESGSAENKIYNVGSGQGCSIDEILEMIGEIADKDVLLDKQKPKGDDVTYNVLDCSRIKEDLGWEAKTDIRETIKEMWVQA